jgi:hypothetical protein
VRIDDRLVPAALVGTGLLADPGERHVVVSTGDATQEREVTLAEGQSATERFEIVAPPEPEPVAAPPESAPVEPVISPPPREPMADDRGTSTQSILGWTATGLGAAALLVGGGFYTDAAVRYGDLDCPGGGSKCGPTSKVETYNRSRVIGLVGFGVGGALVATGIALLLTDAGDPGPTAARITPWISLTEPGAGVAATF